MRVLLAARGVLLGTDGTSPTLVTVGQEGSWVEANRYWQRLQLSGVGGKLGKQSVLALQPP